MTFLLPRDDSVAFIARMRGERYRRACERTTSLGAIAQAVRHAPDEQSGRELYGRIMRVRRWDRAHRPRK